VVLALANRIEGGVAAYQWAYTFFYLPHALVGVPIFSVLFTAMAEKAAAEDTAGVMERLRQGLGMLAFVLIPVAAGAFVLAGPIAVVALDHGAMGRADAALVGRVLAMFALGLPAFSTFLVLTRAFYAVGDTKMPAIVNGIAVVASSLLGAVLFLTLDEPWKVPGLALGHTMGAFLGAVLLSKRLGARLGSLGAPELTRTALHALGGALLAAVAMAGVQQLDIGAGAMEVLRLGGAGLMGALVYLAVMMWAKVPELERLKQLLGGAR
jgi:putative peptidoglycan lipid II flippase